MIPQALEQLILQGKAQHTIFSHVGGGYQAWNFPPDKIVIIYEMLCFPFFEHQTESGIKYHMFQYTLRSKGSRETFPIKFNHDLNGDEGTINRSEAVRINTFSVHRGRLVFDVKIYATPPTWTLGVGGVGFEEEAERQPFGFEGLNVIQTIDFIALVPFNYNCSPNPLFPLTPGANVIKPEPPADALTQLNQLRTNQASTTFENICVVHFNAVLCDSSNFDKIKTW